MGFAPIHQNAIVKMLDTSEFAHLGGYTMQSDTELKHIRLVIYKHGAAAGSEQMRLGVYSRSDLAGAIALSDWVDVADFIEGATHWIGFVRFDFARQFLDSDSTYHLGIETQNYTRNGGTFYLSVVADWPDPVNSPQNDAAYFAAAAHFFGYEERDK